jgi:hypothetical protein
MLSFKSIIILVVTLSQLVSGKNVPVRARQVLHIPTNLTEPVNKTVVNEIVTSNATTANMTVMVAAARNVHSNLEMSSNDVIVLTSSELVCYSCVDTSNRSPECSCDSAKCVVKTVNARSVDNGKSLLITKN